MIRWPAVALDPNLVTTQPVTVDVEVTGSLSRFERFITRVAGLARQLR